MTAPTFELSRRRLSARIAELEAEVERLRGQVLVEEPQLGWIYFHQCGNCGRERQIDISPPRLAENHTMQLAEDAHRARIHELNSPEAQHARAQHAAEMREAAEERQRKRATEARVDHLKSTVELVTAMADGPWGRQQEEQ